FVAVTYPRDVPIGTNQERGRRVDGTDDGQLPRAFVTSLEKLHAVAPRTELDAKRAGQGQQQALRSVQVRKEPPRAIGGDEVEVRATAAEQRMSRVGIVGAEIVANVEPRQQAPVVFTWAVHVQDGCEALS